MSPNMHKVIDVEEKRMKMNKTFKCISWTYGLKVTFVSAIILPNYESFEAARKLSVEFGDFPLPFISLALALSQVIRSV